MAINNLEKLAHDENGFTLIESIVSLALISSVVVGLLGSISTMMFSQRSRLLEEAFIAAQHELVTMEGDGTHVSKTTNGKFIIETVVFQRVHATEVVIRIIQPNTDGKVLMEISKITANRK